ncbi:Immunoglobulin I-set domain [Popillia japonica]|uniref:Immunoglobulin I-set domain n=1 Tax=Popillia japonica TaxID=7064 RepID=A0AAW1MDU2_POPJA
MLNTLLKHLAAVPHFRNLIIYPTRLILRHLYASGVLGAVQSGGGAAGNSVSDSSPNRGPHFDTSASRNVTALLGKTAYLNCRVKNLANRTVSWVRHRDVHLLTVGHYTYTSDQRFRAIHQPHSEDWTLQIKYPQHRDSGIYECQVSSTPHLSHFIHLTVIGKSLNGLCLISISVNEYY